MLSVRITNNMHDFSSSVNPMLPPSAAALGDLWTWEDPRPWTDGGRTCTETRSSTERSPGPQVAVHHSSSNQLEEQVEWILELVI